MNLENRERLEELLANAHEKEQPLRVHFGDGDIYELIGFWTGQDFDEEYPHCFTTVVLPVQVPQGKLKFFSPDAAMSFHLDEISEIREIETGKVLFKS